MNKGIPSQGTASSFERDQPKPLIDWLAWALQLVVGFLVGCGIGYQAARLLVRSDLIHSLLITAGLGFVCGAFTSYYGNRAWMARSIFVAAETPAPRRARACSVLIGTAGIALTLLTTVHHAITASRSGHGGSFTGFDAFPLVAALLPAFLAVHALRTGTGFWRFGILNREETPLFFWAYIVINVSAFLGLLSLMV